MPLINGIYLRTENRLIQINEKIPMSYNGEIKLFFKAYDLLDRIPIRLKKVKIFINDDLVRDYDFRYLIKRDNVYYIDLIILLKKCIEYILIFTKTEYLHQKWKNTQFKTEVTDFDNKTVIVTRAVNFY